MFTTLTAEMLSALTGLEWLDLTRNQFSALPSGLFSSLTRLRWLWLDENRFAVLPDGLFTGLTALTRVDLAGNTQDPLALTVGLEITGAGRFRATVPAAAPFELLLPIQVTNGTVSGGHAHISVAQGSTESSSYSVSRTSGSTAAVAVDLGARPAAPEADSGYELARSDDLPLEVITANAGVNVQHTTLTFTSDNWQTRQWVTLTSTADADTDDATVTVTHSVAGGDYAGLSVASVRVTVAENLADTNAAPEFTSDAEFDVDENEAAVGDVVATDADTDDYVTGYSNGGGGDSGLFEISHGGALRFADPPDFEKPQDLESTSPANAMSNNEYIVDVTASSGSGTREMTATQTVTVTVKDETEPPGTPPAPIVRSGNSRNAVEIDPGRRPVVNTGPDIAYYNLQFRKKNQGSFRAYPFPLPSLNLNVTGLDANSTYEFQARAVNDEGSSNWSPSGEATTPGNQNPRFLSDRVGTVTATAGGAVVLTQARRAFTDPDGDPLDIEASSSNESVATVDTPGILAAITPLAVGSTTITLRASDQNGGTARGSFSVRVRSPTVPDSTVTIDDTDKSITVAFTESFGANEIRTYDFRVRQKEPRGGWDHFCRALENAEMMRRDIDVSSELPIDAFYEPGITYEADYRYAGDSCADASAPGLWSTVSSVTAAASSSFDVEVVLVGTGISSTVTQAFQDAAARWEQIITRSLPDIDFSNQPLAASRCTAGQPEVNDTVDDLRVYGRVTEIDGTGGTLVVASVCLRREASTLPVIGKVILDADDAAARSASEVESINLHEIGHTLGIGTLWHHHDLLKKPALDSDDEDVEPVPDAYFSGPLATAEFDAAGGMDYADNKVPVHNTGRQGNADSHWRESVFNNELMSPYFTSGTQPLSTITVQSLADMR